MALDVRDHELSAALAVDIVPMRRRHLRSVMRIESQVYPRPWTVGLFLSELAMRATRAYHVARLHGAVVGYSGVMVNADEAHLTTIAVDPAWHSHGIGTRLMLNLIESARLMDAQHLTLEVRVSNQAAQRLYRTFGFRPAGIRKNYYSETHEDALVMWADDIDQIAYQQRLRKIESALQAKYGPPAK